MKKISLKSIIEKVIEENPSKNNVDKKKELIEAYEDEMIEYEKKLTRYRNEKKLNRKTKCERPKKPKADEINKKRIEGMRDKFKNILESFDVDPELFKIGKKYIFPKKSFPYVKQILLFDLNKTPVYNLKKDGDKEYHFNQQQLEQIAKLRKVINKLIGYQQNNYEGLATAKQITRKLKINDKRAERYIDELFKEKHQVAKKVSQLFDEKMYPSLTIKKRADIFNQIYLDIETFLESLDERIHEAIEQTKETNYK